MYVSLKRERVAFYSKYTIHFLPVLIYFLKIVITQVGDASRFWTWMTNIFVPAIFATNWYNGNEESNKVYISDKSSVLIGMPRIRQLRVQQGKKLHSTLCTDFN